MQELEFLGCTKYSGANRQLVWAATARLLQMITAKRAAAKEDGTFNDFFRKQNWCSHRFGYTLFLRQEPKEKKGAKADKHRKEEQPKKKGGGEHEGKSKPTQ